MIKGVNEIAFNNENNIKLKENKNENHKGFDKLVKKFSKDKNEVSTSKDKLNYEKDNETLKTTKYSKENLSEVKDPKTVEIKDIDTKDMNVEDMDVEDSLKNTNEQLYLLIQNIFLQNVPEDLEELLNEGNELGNSIEELILNVVEDISKEDIDFKETLKGVNIKDLGLEEKVNKEEFKETIKGILQNPEDKEELLKEIKSTISSLIKEEVTVVKKDFTNKNTITSGEELHTKVATKKENLSKSSSEDFFNKEETSEDTILKNILGDKEENKFSKTINFMNQFNKIANVENPEMETVENIVANRETLNTDVIKAVKYMELNNIKNLTVKVTPKELGELVIKITMESGKMKANITANNKETFNLLNANLQDITDKLQKGAIKIENFSLNLYEDTTFFSNDKDKSGEGSKEKKKNNLNGNINIEDDIKEDRDYLGELSNLSILA